VQYFFTEATLIHAIRKLYGYSQKEFCVFLGYSQSTLSKIENGICSPDMKFVIALSQKINIDLNIFKFGFVPKIPDYLLNNESNQFLQHTYLKNGLFSSKTVYTLLETIKERCEIDIYKKLNIPKEYFVFKELKYNLQLFKDILKYVETNKVIELIEDLKTKNVTLLAEDSFKECLLDLNIIHLKNIIKIEDSYEIGLSYSDLEFTHHDEKTKDYFQHIIAFHLFNELNVNVSPIKLIKSKYDLVLRLNAG
jgi:transcriptional regulator with XRE-family HTH domain